jgi:hypothetical protein
MWGKKNKDRRKRRGGRKDEREVGRKGGLYHLIGIIWLYCLFSFSSIQYISLKYVIGDTLSCSLFSFLFLLSSLLFPLLSFLLTFPLFLQPQSKKKSESTVPSSV